MFVPALVGFFDRSFQPHLDQVQHGPINYPPSHRLHKLGMGDSIEVAAQVRVNDLLMTGVDQSMDALYRVQRTTISPIGILFRQQIGLEDWFEHQHCRRLRNPIPDCRYS